MIKPGNDARAVWRTQTGQRERIALLYLHGFTASPGEAGELPEQMAQALGANLYVHRWHGHGLTTPDAMCGLTPDRLMISARQALDEALQMGDKVAIVGSSLGGTLGLWLAATRPANIAAVVVWSPGVRAADPALLDRMCEAQEPLVDTRPRSPAVSAFWSDTIHPDGFRTLRGIFRNFEDRPPWPSVRCPVFMGYYRSPQGDEDQTASVPAMLSMFDALGTPTPQKCAVAFATGAHVIGSPHKTPQAGDVARASIEFLITHLPETTQASAG